jgi:hypothetical protein
VHLGCSCDQKCTRVHRPAPPSTTTMCVGCTRLRRSEVKAASVRANSDTSRCPHLLWRWPRLYGMNHPPPPQPLPSALAQAPLFKLALARLLVDCLPRRPSAKPCLPTPIPPPPPSYRPWPKPQRVVHTSWPRWKHAALPLHAHSASGRHMWCR